MIKQTFLILSLLVSISFMSCLYALDLSTPEKTTKLLVKAIQEKDYSLWFKCMSSSDKLMNKEMINSKHHNCPDSIKNKEEYLMGNLIQIIGQFEDNDKGKISPYDLFYIKSVYTWDDKYAEVLLFLPLDIRGSVTPPVKFCFIKEKREWKMLYMLSFCNFLNNSSDIGYSNEKSELVDSYLKLFENFEIDRENTDKAVKKDYKMDNKLSAKYNDYWALKQDDMFLFVWSLTGDEKADEILKTKPLPMGEEEIGMFKKLISFEIPKEGKRFERTKSNEAKLMYSYIKNFSFRTPVAYKNYIKMYPDNLELVNKARFDMTYLYLEFTNYTEAEKELSLIIASPDTSRTKIEAKVRLARLYWDELGNKEAAQKLWKELDAIGKLPENTQYDKNFPIVPKQIIKSEVTKFRQGFHDLLLDDKGNLLIMGYYEEGKKLIAKIDKYDNKGDFIKNVLKQESAPYSSNFFMHDNKYYLENTGKLFVVENNEFTKVLIDRKDSILTEIYPSVTDRAGVPAKDYCIDKENFFALDYNEIRVYNFITGKLLYTLPIYEKETSDSYYKIYNFTDKIIFNQPTHGKVKFFKKESTEIKELQIPPISENAIESIDNIYCDLKSNLYIVDRSNKRILKYDKNWKFIRAYHNSRITDPTKLAVDENENLYVVGYGFDGGTDLVILDKNNQYIRTIDIDTHALPNISNGNILDVEVLNDKIVIQVDKCAAIYDMNGKKLNHYSFEENDLEIIHNMDKEVFVLGDCQVFIIENDKFSKLYDVDKITFMLSYYIDKERNYFMCGYDIKTYNLNDKAGNKEVKTIKYDKNHLNAGVVFKDPDSNYVVLDANSREVLKINKEGRVVNSISRSENARKKCTPTCIAEDKEKNIYVFDRANKTLMKFTPEGEFVREYKFASFYETIQIDKDNNLYMFERYDHRSIYKIGLKEMF